MPTRKEGNSSASESRTPASRVRRTGKPVRVWAEAGVTVCVTEEPPQYIRFTTGHERIAPDDSPKTIRQVEQQIYEQCEEIVNKRVAKLMQLVKAASTGSTSGRSKRARS